MDMMDPAMKKKQQQKSLFEEEEDPEPEEENVPASSSLSSQSLFSLLKSEPEDCTAEEEEAEALVLDTPNAATAAAEEFSSEFFTEFSSHAHHHQHQTHADVQCFELASASPCDLELEAAVAAACDEEDDDDDVVDVVSECLDFVQAEEESEYCLQEDSLQQQQGAAAAAVTAVGVPPSSGGDGDDGSGVVAVDGEEELVSHCCMEFCKSESLESVDAHDEGYGTALDASESLDSEGVVLVGLVGCHAGSSAAAAAAAGDGASGSDSGECSSGENSKEERSSCSRKAAAAAAAGVSKNAAGASVAVATGGGVGGGKKKAKVDWTPELHRRFVAAVEQLGVEKAFPSRILELMGVQCLTRHNIASHLQKYRSHRRHLAAREAEAATTSWSHSSRRAAAAAAAAYSHSFAASWNNRSCRRSTRSSSSSDGLPFLLPLHTCCKNSPPPIQPRPQPLHSLLAHHQMLQQQQQSVVASMPLKVWGYPTVDHSAVHLWQQAAAATPSFWQAPDGSYWQHPAAGYDVASSQQQPGACYPHPMRVPLATMPSRASQLLVQGGASFSESDSFFADEALPASMYLCSSFSSEFGGAAAAGACCSSNSHNALQIAAAAESSSSHLSKEILDAAISEALANPWTPPPLGLKPPSMEGVIAELRRQGISTVPPSTC